MSFVEQERALFDLLFDRDLRDKFCQDSKAALAGYELNDDERNDFSVLRVDALVVDANIRVSLVMSHICRSFPITFSIISSDKEGVDLLKSLVDAKTMRTPYIERPVEFGKRLSERLSQLSSSSVRQQQLLSAIFQLEIGMAWTAANLKRVVMEYGDQPVEASEVPGDWVDKPVRLAEFVTAGLLPVSFKKIKKRLCPVDDNELWRYLMRTPTSASTINSVLSKDDPRLLVSRARVDHMSLCEPTVSHQTTELSEGFSPLFQHINGKISINTLLLNLKQAGATDQILEGVKSGFYQLLTNEMLKVS